MTLLQSLFRQKAAINEEFFAVIGGVDAEAHAAERDGLIRLMNHIYVVDRIFAAHLGGELHGYLATNTPETPPLQTLHEAVLVSDRGFLELVDTLMPPQLAQSVDFTFTDGQRGPHVARGDARPRHHARQLPPRRSRADVEAHCGRAAARPLYRASAPQRAPAARDGVT